MVGELRIVPLSIDLIDLDLAAYHASPRAIRAHSAGRWPSTLGLAEARRLMAIHEAEHVAGTAYASAVLDRDGKHELGCVYLRPLGEFLERTGTRLHTDGIDPDRCAIVTFWLIDDDRRPPTPRILREIRRWVSAWGAADPVYRCLPAEVSTLAALDAESGLRPIVMTDQGPPYLWFADRDTTASPALSS